MKRVEGKEEGMNEKVDCKKEGRSEEESKGRNKLMNC